MGFLNEKQLQLNEEMNFNNERLYVVLIMFVLDSNCYMFTGMQQQEELPL